MISCTMVILNYNDSRRAWQLAKKCFLFKNIDNVIIVDNKSTDDSLEYFSKQNLRHHIDVIISDENNGFASGNNIGARYVVERYNSDYILFANTDTIFEDGDVESCLKKLQEDDTLGLISMRMKDINGIEEKSSWRFKPFYEYLLHNFWLYRHFNYSKYTYKDFAEGFQYVDVVRGSFMLFKTEALINVDYFDESTFLYYEEDIISYRLRKSNYKVGILTDRFYVHNHIYSDNENKTFINYHLNRSMKYFLCKYYEIGGLKEKILDLSIFIGNIELYFINKLRKDNVKSL